MNIASIDIGTNTVLLLIANISNDDKTIKPLLNEYRMPRIGKGLTQGGKISRESIDKLFQVLEYYSYLIKKYNCMKIIAKGTSALRLASNSDEIIAAVKNRFNIDIEVISGKEEASLSFMGSVSTVKSESYVVIDIGGGSTEVVFGEHDKIIYSKSFEAGVVNLTEKFLKNDPPLQEELLKLNDEIYNIFSELKDNFPKEAAVIAVAGTPTSLSCIKQGLSKYDEDKVEGSLLFKDELRQFIDQLAQLKHSEIISRYQEIVSGREDIILTGTAILYIIAQILQTGKIIVSGRGIRFGAIIDYLIRN